MGLLQSGISQFSIPRGKWKTAAILLLTLGLAVNSFAEDGGPGLGTASFGGFGGALPPNPPTTDGQGAAAETAARTTAATQTAQTAPIQANPSNLYKPGAAQNLNAATNASTLQNAALDEAYANHHITTDDWLAAKLAQMAGIPPPF